MESAQNGTTAFVSGEQYKTFCDDYNDGYNELQWLCNSCKGQNTETTQSEMPIRWGKMKDLKKIRKRKSEKVLIRHIKKL